MEVAAVAEGEAEEVTGGASRSKWTWTRQKEEAAFLLAEGKTWAVLEAQHGIPHSTLAKWMKHPEFQARIEEHLETIVADARRLLRRNATFAAQRVIDMAFNGRNEHSTRLAAAKDVLDRVGLKPVEKTDGDLRIRWEYGDSDGYTPDPPS